MENYSREINAATNKYINDHFDRMHVIVPIGTKALLRRRFPKGMTLNKYINLLIDMDLRNCIDWGLQDERCAVLREMAAAEKS